MASVCDACGSFTFTALKAERDRLRQRVAALEAEVRLLRGAATDPANGLGPCRRGACGVP